MDCDNGNKGSVTGISISASSLGITALFDASAHTTQQDNDIIVEHALQGTHKGPLPTPMGILPPTERQMDAPCCDVFRLVNGKIRSFNCYPSGTVILAQLGVLSNIEAAVTRS